MVIEKTILSNLATDDLKSVTLERGDAGFFGGSTLV
jgi:hypothetical protein